MINEIIVDRIPCKLFVYNYMEFGKWLRETMDIRRVSNAELARRAGVSATYVGKLVRNYSPNMKDERAPRPSEPVVGMIAKALDVPLNEARNAAGYSAIDDETKGLFSGYKELPPERQAIARHLIRATIDSLAEKEDHDFNYIDDED